MPQHPLNSKSTEPTKNRLKRQSPNHLAKANKRTISEILPPIHETEELQNHDPWNKTEWSGSRLFILCIRTLQNLGGSQFLLFCILYGPITKFSPGGWSKDVCVMLKSKMAPVNQLRITYFMVEIILIK